MTFEEPRPRLAVCEPPYADEALGGYLQRLRRINAVGSAGWMWSLLSQLTGTPIREPLDVASNSDALAALESLASLEAGTLVDRELRRLVTPTDSIYRRDMVDFTADALATRWQQVCPECLRLAEYVRTDWEYWHAPICREHHCLLLDRCPECGERLGHARLNVARCERCHLELTDVAPRPLTEDILVGASLVLARRPIQFGSFRLTCPVSTLDLFGLWRLAVLPCLGEEPTSWLEGQVDRLPAQRRAEACGLLGGCVIDGRIDSARLRAALLRRAPPWRNLPTSLQLELLQEMAATAGAHGAVLHMLMRDEPEPPDFAALTHFNRRPPRLFARDEAAKWLGLDIRAFLLLAKLNYPSVHPAEDMGYDIDEVMALGQRMEQYVEFARADEVLGADGLCHELVELHCLETVSFDGSRRLVDLRALSTMLGELQRAIPAPIAQEPSVRLGDAMASGLSVRDAARFLAMVRSGSTRITDWAAPYRAVDLVLPVPDLLRLVNWQPGTVAN